MKLQIGIAALVLICSTASAEINYSVKSGCDLEQLNLSQPTNDKVRVDGSNCDSQFVKSDWSSAPNVVFPQAKDGKNYMLLMLDPDAPNHPEGTYYFHWAVTNVPAAILKSSGDISKAIQLLSYRGPSPPKGTGKHRYIFFLYEQDTDEEIREPVPEIRAKFNLRNWLSSVTQKHSLNGPVGGSQFKVEYTE